MAVHVACSRIGQPRRARCLVDTAVYLARIVLALAAVFAASQRNIYRCPLPILTTTTTRSPTSKAGVVRASASLNVKNCLFHALARTYAHFFISILYVNFQFGSNEYILIVWHSSSLAAKLLRRVTRAKPDVYSS